MICGIDSRCQNDTMKQALLKAKVRIRKTAKRWPRAKNGTGGVTKMEGGVRNLHFTVNSVWN